MMKLLHSADWHLDAPLTGHSEAARQLLRQAQLSIPERIVTLAKENGCDMLLLGGDLFDGTPSPESLQALRKALACAAMPVLIAPGNHDPYGLRSPWSATDWPENVHIFSGGIQSICFPQLDCRVYGAGFSAADCPPLLEGFRAECTETYAIGLFHGDPIQPASPHDPITRSQVLESGLDYLALGHIHKGDSFRAGDTLCAWPGCPMGHGFDETGEKGVLIVTLDGGCHAQFVPLPLPRFHWLAASPDSLADVLPSTESSDFYRVDLTGEWEAPDLAALAAAFPHIPHLQLRDHTVPPIDLWANAGADTLEGTFFQLLQEADADTEVIELAARLCRQLLNGQEVSLP